MLCIKRALCCILPGMCLQIRHIQLFISKNHVMRYYLATLLSRSVWSISTGEKDRKRVGEIQRESSRLPKREPSAEDEHLYLKGFEPTQQVAPRTAFIEAFKFFLLLAASLMGSRASNDDEEKRK